MVQDVRVICGGCQHGVVIKLYAEQRTDLAHLPHWS